MFCHEVTLLYLALLSLSFKSIFANEDATEEAKDTIVDNIQNMFFNTTSLSSQLRENEMLSKGCVRAMFSLVTNVNKSKFNKIERSKLVYCLYQGVSLDIIHFSYSFFIFILFEKFLTQLKLGFRSILNAGP